jgi:hypothetical protein
MTESEAVRVAIQEAAARRRARAAIRDEVRGLAADDLDRDEMRAIREQMADLAADRPRWWSAAKSSAAGASRDARSRAAWDALRRDRSNRRVPRPEHHACRPDLDKCARSELPPHGHDRRARHEGDVEQTTVVDPHRLGRSAARFDATELRAGDEARSLILGL